MRLDEYIIIFHYFENYIFLNHKNRDNYILIIKKVNYLQKITKLLHFKQNETYTYRKKKGIYHNCLLLLKSIIIKQISSHCSKII